MAGPNQLWFHQFALCPSFTLMIELLSNPAVWASFATLTILEIVLGVDNVIFISIAAC